MADKPFSKLAAEVLVEWTQELIGDMQADLGGQLAAGTRSQLAASIVPSYKDTGEAVVMELSLNDYYDFVDKGVSGKIRGVKDSPYRFKDLFPAKKFVDSIDQWITSAGIPVPPGKGDVLKRRRSFAYAITTNIKKRGLKAKPFFEKNLNQQRIDDLANRLTEVLGREISIKLLE